LGKYPEIFEILPDYLHLAERYPFLDVVISYTTHDKCCCYGCDALEECEEYTTMRRSADCKYKECIPYLDLIFKYNNKEWNGKPDLTCICDKAFVGDCFEYLGKPRKLCDEYVERGFISPFNESTQVVTKDWVISQYHAFISRGGMII